MVGEIKEPVLRLWKALAVALFPVCVISAPAAEYAPGTEYSAVVPGSGTAMKIYVPSNYDSARKWPLVVFYHGMNASPTTECIVRHTDGRDFIVAGITYCENGESGRTGGLPQSAIEKERSNFRSAVKWVSQNLSLDPKRVFLGGVSKGGWTTSFVGERELANLAGMLILLAGRQRGAVPGPQKMEGFPVFIGAGETDPNLLPAVHAVAFYRCCGAELCFEEFAGTGHSVPAKAEGLSRWLEAYGALSHPWLDAAVKQDRLDTYRREYEEITAASGDEKACGRLRELVTDPRLVVVCGRPTRDAIMTKLISLSGSVPQTAGVHKAEELFYGTVWKEWKMKTVDDTRDILAGYEKVRQMAPGSRWAGYAAKSRERLVPVYESALKQMEELRARQKSERPPPARPGMRSSSGTGGVSVF